MNRELVFIAWIAGGSVLFPLGGTGNWVLAWKGWRRYVFPIICFYVLLILGCHYTRALASSTALSAVLHMGYGDSYKYWQRFLVFMSYAIPPAFVITGSWWPFVAWIVITPTILLLAFLASRKLNNTLVWKVWEALAGFLIVASFIPYFVN